MESKVHQMNWFQSGKHSFYFWNQFRILVHSNLEKSHPWKLKSRPKSGKLQNRPLNALNLPLEGDFAHVEYRWSSQKTTHFAVGCICR